MPLTRTHSCRRAFTLVEILAVVIILGIISAILVPQISGRDDQKTATAARVVMSDLMYAQNRAITTQKTQYVQFDTVNKKYQIVDKLSPLTIVKNPVNGASYVVTFGSGSLNGLSQMSLQSASFDSQTTLAFDSMGVPYSCNGGGTLTPLSTGTVVVKSGTCQMTVTVAAFSGELTVQ